MDIPASGNQARCARYRTQTRTRGLVQVNVMVPIGQADELRAIAAQMRAGQWPQERPGEPPAAAPADPTPQPPEAIQRPQERPGEPPAAAPSREIPVTIDFPKKPPNHIRRELKRNGLKFVNGLWRGTVPQHMIDDIDGWVLDNDGFLEIDW